jgi:hypothetical protein
MEQADFLTAAAQIAVGLAGFTGVASALSSRPAEVPAEVQAERLRAMIEAALVAVVFSLVPLLLSDLKFSEATLWRLSSGLYLAGWTSTFAITVRRGFRVLRDVQLEADRSWRAVVAAIGVLCFGSLLSGGSGFHASSCYLFALLLQLILCALFFYRFFASLRRSVSS